MGWYLDKENCPNCDQKANVMFRSSCLESYYLVCSSCGLHLYCRSRQWIPTKSFINKDTIGKEINDLDYDELYNVFNEKEDEKIITTPQ